MLKRDSFRDMEFNRNIGPARNSLVPLLQSMPNTGAYVCKVNYSRIHVKLGKPQRKNGWALWAKGFSFLLTTVSW